MAPLPDNFWLVARPQQAKEPDQTKAKSQEVKILQFAEVFGKFGQILKIPVNPNNPKEQLP